VKRILGAVAFLAMVGIASTPAQSGEDKVTICHFPPGNPDNAHTIVVGASAVPAHLELHGDFIGSCETGPGDPG
jgi:hypothetical protein